MGHRIKRQLPGGQSETFGYDAAGNMLAHTNFNGLVLTNLFDSLNRLLSKWSGATALETYAYDANGQRTNRVDTSGSYVWILDNRGRVRTNSTPVVEGSVRQSTIGLEESKELCWNHGAPPCELNVPESTIEMLIKINESTD